MKSKPCFEKKEKAADAAAAFRVFAPWLCLLWLLCGFAFCSGSSTSIIQFRHLSTSAQKAQAECNGKHFVMSSESYVFQTEIPLGSDFSVCYYRQADWPAPVATVFRNVSATRTADTVRTPRFLAGI